MCVGRSASASSYCTISTSGWSPIHAVEFAKDVERFKLFFLEDALAPEDIVWFRHIRGQCATPLAMGELFNNPHEWQLLIQERLIDFIRMHISQMGGITPARNVAIFADMYGIRTAWHGPSDTSPVGHAANLQLDLMASQLRRAGMVSPVRTGLRDFPRSAGCRGRLSLPQRRVPGLGIDINEELAAKYPPQDIVEEWTQTRLPDGSPARP